MASKVPEKKPEAYRALSEHILWERKDTINPVGDKSDRQRFKQ